jgi:hypothetical protein
MTNAQQESIQLWLLGILQGTLSKHEPLNAHLSNEADGLIAEIPDIGTVKIKIVVEPSMPTAEITKGSRWEAEGWPPSGFSEQGQVTGVVQVIAFDGFCTTVRINDSRTGQEDRTVPTRTFIRGIEYGQLKEETSG